MGEPPPEDETYVSHRRVPDSSFVTGTVKVFLDDAGQSVSRAVFLGFDESEMRSTTNPWSYSGF